MQRKDEYRDPNVRPGENIDALTDKIILAVLDFLEINSPVSTDSKTKGPLTSMMDNLKKIVVKTDVEKSGKTKGNVKPLSNELRNKAARTVSRLLLSSTEAWEITRSSSSFPSSLASEPDLDSMFKAMAQLGFPTGVMRSLLDSTSHSIVQTIVCNKRRSAYRIFTTKRMTKTINEKVKMSLAVCKELVRTEATHTCQMDNLTIMCTHYIIDEIIQVCHAHGGGEQGVQEVMQVLESFVRSWRSSSKNDLRVIDLEEHHESLLSDEFHQKVKRAISDALLKTTGAVLAQLNTTTGDIVVEDLEMCDEQSATSLESSHLIESAASDMAETFIEDLKKVSSQQVDDGSVTEPEPSRETCRSAARRLYRNVHFKVFGFLSRLQESHSSPPPHIIPRYNTCSCMDEACFNLVELYKSEPLLSSSSYGRALSSPAQTTSAADEQTAAVAEAAERNLESRNSSRKMLNQRQDVKTDPATVKKRGLRIRKRLTRIFSSIRRALPNPFQCMSGQP